MEKTKALKTNKMGVMNIPRLLFTMAVPMVLSMLIQALYNIVDSIFVSMLSEDALTAVSIVFPVQNLMISVAVGTGVGINALLSRSLGERNRIKVNKTANNGIMLELLGAIPFILFGVFLSHWFISIQTDSSSIIEYGSEYTFIVCVFSVGLFMQVACERLLQSTGKTILSMTVQLIGAIINIILDPILIFGLLGLPRMEVIGAAVATVIGQSVAALVGIILNIKFNREIRLSFKRMLPQKAIVAQIYRVGLPSIIMTSITSVMTLAVNMIVMKFSSTATAVFGAFAKLQSFVFMPIFGMNNAMVPIISFNYGARNRERIIKTIKLCIISAFLIMFVGFAVMQLIPDKLLLMFNASEGMLEIGNPALRIISIGFLFAGFSVIFCSVFQALDCSKYSMFVSIARQLVVLVPVAYLLSFTGVLDAVWAAFPIAELVSLICCLFYYKRVYSGKMKNI